MMVTPKRAKNYNLGNLHAFWVNTPSSVFTWSVYVQAAQSCGKKEKNTQAHLHTYTKLWDAYISFWVNKVSIDLSISLSIYSFIFEVRLGSRFGAVCYQLWLIAQRLWSGKFPWMSVLACWSVHSQICVKRIEMSL